MRFLNPSLAIWFLGVPLAFGAWYFHVHGKRRFRERAAIGRHLRLLSHISTRTRDWMSLAAALVAVASVTLALMRPQILLEWRLPEYEREDLILILDRSVSMRAEDIQPSRFARAVTEIKTFLARKPDAIDRVGLVGFSGTALIVSHLTRDMNSLFFYLDWINEDAEPNFGTDIGAALSSARELARKDKRQTRKIFLLLSDGDDQGSTLSSELAVLRTQQTRVYTIGIGSDGDVTIPVAGQSGGASFLQDEQGNLVKTRFSETTLREVATLTGGRYFRSVTGTELAAAMAGVVERERKVVGWTTSVEYRDVYRECLAAGAAAILLLLLTL